MCFGLEGAGTQACFPMSQTTGPCTAPLLFSAATCQDTHTHSIQARDKTVSWVEGMVVILQEAKKRPFQTDRA